MASTVDLWTPPEGMNSLNVKAWRAFYSRALDTYDVVPRDYRRLYIAQRGRCWICRTAKGIHPDDPLARGSRRLGIDHNHLTGEVRGLLCTGGDKTCNRIIGWLTAPQLQRASHYLAYRKDQPARVLQVVEAGRLNALEEGVELTEQELDKLADAYLWRDR